MANLFRQGEHICAVFETEEQHLAIAAEYVADGLLSGEQVLYVCQSDAAVQRFHAALREIGINIEAMRKRGALIESTHANAHLAGNRFDCERMLTLLNEAVEAALNGGFTGLRACGDMSWLLAEPEGAEQVVEYEALLNQFFQGVRGCGMCLYDRRRLHARLVDHALATHSSVIIDGHHRSNPFYRPSAITAERTAKPEDLNWKLATLRQQS
jgi:hypothetical protein